MKLITMTYLDDDDEVEVENYDTDTGAYSRLRAKHPATGGEDLVVVGAVANGYIVGSTTVAPLNRGYIVGSTTVAPLNRGYAVVDSVFAGKLQLIPPEDDFVDLASSEYQFVAGRQADNVGIVLTTSGAILVAQAAGEVAYTITPYGTWPIPSDSAFQAVFALQMADGSVRLIEADAAAGLLRVSTAFGEGDLDVSATTPMPIPPEGTAGDEAYEYGALALAKAMNLAKSFGVPAHVIGSLRISWYDESPPTVRFARSVSIICPDDAGRYAMWRYGMTGPELAEYTADGTYSAFTVGPVTTYPDPTSPTVDIFWFVPTDPTPGAFWQKFKRAEEQV